MSDIAFAEDTSHLHIRFYEATVKNNRKSTEAGRPVHDAVDMVEIRIAGDKQTVINAPANDKSKFIPGHGHISYKERFPRHWEAYERTKTNVLDGTPLEEFPAIDAARRADLKAVNIHTIEALASVDDNKARKLGMDGTKLRDMARDYLAKAEANAPISALAEENAQMKDQLSALEAELARLKNAQAETPKGKKEAA